MNIIEHTPAPDAGEPKTTKFFHFRQNNSGGSFVVSEAVAHNVIIEAYSANEANARAVEIGIYFNGCDTGADCNCCGDRWRKAWGDGDASPLIYDEAPELCHEHFAREGQPMCHVYHHDGSKTTYRKPAKEKAE